MTKSNFKLANLQNAEKCLLPLRYGKNDNIYMCIDLYVYPL